jgi:hypothetical protein
MKNFWKILRWINFTIGFVNVILGLMLWCRVDLWIGIYFLLYGLIVIPVLSKMYPHK